MKHLPTDACYTSVEQMKCATKQRAILLQRWLSRDGSNWMIVYRNGYWRVQPA